MFRRFSLAVVAGGAIAFTAGMLTAQDASVLDDLYGRGVHAYNSHDSRLAYDYLSQAIDNGSQDPRAFYFRGLSLVNLGRPDDARLDFQEGAKIESSGEDLRTVVSRSLERVQGPIRLELEGVRKFARLKTRNTRLEREDRRYQELQNAEKEVLRTPAGAARPAARIPTTLPPVPATNASDPFAEGAATPARGTPAVPPVAPAPARTPAGAPPAAVEPAPAVVPAGDAADPFGDAAPAAPVPAAPPKLAPKPVPQPATPALAEADADPFGDAAPEAPTTPPPATPSETPADEGVADPFGDAAPATPAPAAPPKPAPTAPAPAAAAADDADPFGDAAPGTPAPAAVEDMPADEGATEPVGEEASAMEEETPAAPTEPPAAAEPAPADADPFGATSAAKPAVAAAPATPAVATPATVQPGRAGSSLFRALGRGLIGDDAGPVAAKSVPVVAPRADTNVKPASGTEVVSDPFADDPEPVATKVAPATKPPTSVKKADKPAAGDDPFAEDPFK